MVENDTYLHTQCEEKLKIKLQPTTPTRKHEVCDDKLQTKNHVEKTNKDTTCVPVKNNENVFVVSKNLLIFKRKV